jgi:hypothetical protein
MAIIELVLIIFKTLILSCIYATIVLLLVMLIIKYNRSGVYKTLKNHKLQLWAGSFFLISIMLLIVSFSYTNNTGLGDNSRIPIGYNQTIQNEDFQWTYFYPDLTKTEANKNEIVITNYIIAKNEICAEVSHENTDSPEYDFLVYHLPSQKLLTFRTANDYEKYAKTKGLPSISKFCKFEKHYHDYLQNRTFWKKWLLP